MLVLVVQTIVVLAGLAICGLCAVGATAPDRLLGWVRSAWARPTTLGAAVGARLLLGLSLILLADQTPFPAILTALGGLAIVAALAIPLIGRSRIAALIAALAELPPGAMRLASLAGFAFGSFLIYAALASSA